MTDTQGLRSQHGSAEDLDMVSLGKPALATVDSSETPWGNSLMPMVFGKGGYNNSAASKEPKTRAFYQLFRKDFVHSLLNLGVWSFMGFFAVAYILSWLGFGCIYYIIALYDGDCLVEVESFNSVTAAPVLLLTLVQAVLLAIETETTIGYGARHYAGDCRYGTAILMANCLYSTFLSSVVLGLVFVKITRPQNRARSIRCRWVQALSTRL